MVKNKRDLKSPRRRNSLTLARPLTRAKSSTTSVSVAPAAANIRVVVRIRPPNEREQSDNHRIVVKVVDDQMLVFDPKEDAQPFFYHGMQQRGRDLLRKANKDLQFVFDKVFGYQATNIDVFQNTTQCLITSLMDGYNCSVFAYGATGAGKTHTMLGHDGHPGITYLTMAELFKQKNSLTNERDFELGITYLEVYNELVQDLLNPGTPLHLREDGKYGVMVAGNKIHKIDNPGELFELLEEGNKNRTQHPTDANAESSRSHAVFQVYIQMNIRATSEMRTAKLSMIDLAGSERGAATGFAGARFTEGANINKSLLALGNCINSLADGQRHVPYRDSKLTRLLKDSLGGNCQTVMIANISPSSLTYEDTYNTLKYATRAKKIKSHMKKNVVNVEMHVGQYVKMVDELNKEVERLKSELKNKEVLVKPADPVLSNQLMKLFSDRKQLLHRILQLEVSEKTLLVRRQLKEEADSRLSGLCADTPDRIKGHKRLGNIVDRCNRQETALKEELSSMETIKADLTNKTNELVRKYPELKQVEEIETARLNEIESQYRVELTQKENDLLRDELKSRGNLLEKMSKLLQSCYLQVRGHGFATDSLMKDYQSLVSKLQGIRNVTWDEDIGDSGLSTTRSVTSDEDGRAIKRKIDDDVCLNSTTSLDSTYVMTPNKPKVKICAGQLLGKALKPPPPKRVAKVNSASPRLKENRLLRKPLSTVDHSNRVMALKNDRKDIPSRKAVASVHRPPFRR